MSEQFEMLQADGDGLRFLGLATRTDRRTQSRETEKPKSVPFFARPPPTTVA
jgi:hypothetical protein